MAAPEKKIPKQPRQWFQSGSAAPSNAALRAADLRIKEAGAAKSELEAQKLAGEVARQSLEEQLLEVQIQEGVAEVARRHAEVRSLDDARFRGNARLVVILLVIIFVLVLALIDPMMLKMLGVSGLAVTALSALAFRSRDA